ncbi:MAG TPA: hypothetical protein VM598_07980 [Bdellovibrionota bacterium]|nr:hypothetical protein [Bdellovibrionota bacterium]
MTPRNLILLPALLLAFACVPPSPDTTTDGSPNRGGKVTEGPEADDQRGGTPRDWSQGNGGPGSADENPAGDRVGAD